MADGPDEVVLNQPNITIVETNDETELITSGAQGPPGVADEDVARARRSDIKEGFNGTTPDANFTTIYIGEAQVGVLDATAEWRIRRLIIDDTPVTGEGDVKTEWAENGGIATADEIFVWDNRLSLTYS